ncbi:MAG: leucine-rich repeat domain-containing protein, partial [Clostridia bacterium]|nr:leucine-rich repeat domain-containing protein [Clostridia bacterium]
MKKICYFILLVILTSLWNITVLAEDVKIIATGNTAFKSQQYEENCVWVYTNDGVLEFNSENPTGFIGVERDISLDGPPRNTLKVLGYMKTDMYMAPWRKEQWCNDVKTVIIGENISEIGANAFYEMKGLEKVLIKSKEISIGADAFAGCSSLKDVVFCKTKTKDLQSCVFKNCVSLEKIEIPEGCSSLIKIFDGCSNLKEIRLPKSIKGIWLGEASLANYDREITIYYEGGIKHWSEIEVTVDRSVETEFKKMSEKLTVHYGEISVKYNDGYLTLDTIPYIKNDRT